MYAKKRIAELTKAGVEIILVYLAFQSGVEAGLLALAAAGVAAIRVDTAIRQELVLSDRRRRDE